jgi:hypothetical protein
MITRKRTTIQFSEKQCETLELIALNLGIEKPTIPGILATLISDTPEFKLVCDPYDSEPEKGQPNV